LNHRLRIDPGTITVHDRVAGEHAFDPGAREGDCIVWTKSGFPSYQLAVTVDDIAQGVTDVVRGDDLLPSAALQSIIHRALGAEPPRWWHLPLICEAGGARMAKRHGALALSELRARGVDAGRVRGLAAQWIGAIAAPRPLSLDAFRALVTEPILRAWHVGTRSAPPCLDERSLQWLHDS
jgi:glutamyl-tRNA synthetase